MTALWLLQEAAANDPTNGQWSIILSAVLGLTTVILAADRKNQSDRVADARTDVKTGKEECVASLVIERERTARAEGREQEQMAGLQKQATIIAEQTTAIREFAAIAKDSLLESKNAAQKADAAYGETKRNGERLERLDRRTESIERITNQLAYQRGIVPNAPGD